MSHNSPEAPPPSKYEVIFDEALKTYEKKTGKDLKSDSFLHKLDACKSPDETLSELRQQIPSFDPSENNDNRLTNWVNPVVNVLYIFAQTIAGTVGLVSPGAVIFTGICSLLSVVMAVRAVQPAIADLFESIKMFFIRLKIYVKLPQTQEMTEIIVDVMVHVLHVFALLTKEIKQGTIKRFLKKLIGRSDIEDALRRFEKLTQEESRMVTLQNLMTTHGANNKLDVILHGSNGLTGNRICNWLSPPNLSTNFEIAADAHHESTGEWLTQGNVFKSWKQSSSLLWINGKPGSGKTVLSSTIIQDINNTRPGHFGFFFFDFKDAGKSNARSLLSSLIVQLSDQSNDLFAVALHLYSSHRNNTQPPSVDALTECLEDMLRVPHEVPIYLIIDALDECPFTDGQSAPRRQVLTLVEKFVKLNLPNLRICVTSRPEADIQATLGPLTSTSYTISLHDESGQKNDIVNFVTSEVLFYGNLRRWREDDKQFAIKTLSDKADSTFRWVTCQLETLRRCLPQCVRRTLDELPGDLDATYERILEIIPSVNRVYTHRLLQCLSVAARPLEVEELAEVLAIEFDVMGGIPKLTEDFRWENQEQAVLSTCSSLVVIVNNRGSRRVQFSHFSVLEFLSSDRLANSESSTMRYYYIQRESAHTVMAQACLGALLRLGDDMDRGTIESYPLADYAGEFFSAHAKVGEMLSKIHNGVDNLLDPDRPHFNTWLWLQSFDWDSQYFDLNPDSSSDREQHSNQSNSDQSNSEYPIYPPRVSPLYYTLLFGHTSLAQYLIRTRPCDLDATDTYDRTALHIAAFKSDFEVVKMLVNTTHITVDCRDNQGCTPLHYALHDGNQESHEDVSRCVKLLLDHCADVGAQNNRGSTPLHLAASKMSEKTVRLLIENGANINLQNNKNQTALHKASRRGHLEIVRLLLDHKAGIDLQDNHGSTPLHLAIYRMSREAVQLFLDHGADVTLQNVKGQAVLHQALQRGHPDIIQLILSRANVDADTLDNDGSTPLHLAASEAEVLSGAQLLLDRGANIDLRNRKGQTALHLASQRGRLDFMELLLNRGAIVDVPDNDGFTPLHLAISKVERRAAEMLLKHGANINLSNNKGQTALHQASECGNLPFMEVLLSYSADVNVRDNDGLTPLDLAISKLGGSAAQLLAKYGANIDLRNDNGQTALHLASQLDNLNNTWFILENGANVDVPDGDGSTPLHLAISESKPEIAKLLLNRGAKIDLRNNKGQTALHLASQLDSLNIMQFLLENGANVDAPDGDGTTPLHLAISELKLETAKLLLNHGAEIDLRNNKGQTALHLALQLDSLDTMQFLLENGANLDAPDGDGTTPLHLAISKSKLETVKLLLTRGAKVYLQNNKGQTPLHLALQHGGLDSMRLILENGANVDAPDSNVLLKHSANIDLRNDKGQTALHLALQHGSLNIMRFLLEKGVNVDAPDSSGSTPLHLAISGLKLPAAELLLKHGADIGRWNNKDQTALHLASQHGDLGIMRLLLENGANVDSDAPDGDVSTPLHLAISELKLTAAEVLLKHGANIDRRDNEENGANVDAPDSDGSTPLHLTILEDKLQATKLLLEHGANVDLRNNEGRRALHLALQFGNLYIIQLFLENGANVDAPDGGGSFPLHLAIFKLNYTAAELLLKHGANINLRNDKGQTALDLHLTSPISRPKIVRLLLENGTNVDAPDSDGSTPLHLAISSGYRWRWSTPTVLALLLKHGANINLRNNKGQTALHLALRHGNLDIMQSLLENGANVDAPDSDGSTPLHQAISEAYEDSEPLSEVIKLLLEHGASGHMENNRGETPFQLAAVRRLDGITWLLSMSERTA